MCNTVRARELSLARARWTLCYFVGDSWGALGGRSVEKGAEEARPPLEYSVVLVPQ